MAKKDNKPKTVIDREYIIPLRKEFQKAPRYKRAKKAVTALKEFLSRHMKSDNIKIGKHLNLSIWKNGIKNPPHKIKVRAQKLEDGTVTAEIPNPPAERKKEAKKKAQKKQEEKSKETAAKKPQAKKQSPSPEPKKEPAQAEDKKEAKAKASNPKETPEQVKKK